MWVSEYQEKGKGRMGVMTAWFWSQNVRNCLYYNFFFRWICDRIPLVSFSVCKTEELKNFCFGGRILWLTFLLYRDMNLTSSESQLKKEEAICSNTQWNFIHMDQQTTQLLTLETTHSIYIKLKPLKRNSEALSIISDIWASISCRMLNWY